MICAEPFNYAPTNAMNASAGGFVWQSAWTNRPYWILSNVDNTVTAPGLAFTNLAALGNKFTLFCSVSL